MVQNYQIYSKSILILSSLATVSTCKNPAVDDSLPNIVLIMADDMGYGDPGCYNPNSKIPTPNMDRLAEEGIRFTNAHSPSSVCSPTRYGLLTGRYAWRTRLKSGALGPFDPLLPDTTETTLADILKSMDYSTAITGKWHLGLGVQDSIDFSKSLRPGPLELGFDYFFGINASLNMSPHCFIENHHVLGTPDFPVPAHIFSNHGTLTMTKGWRHEDVGPTITRKAMEWISNHCKENPNKPFFLYLPTSAPHRPCVPPKFIRGKSKAGARGDMVAEVDWTTGEIIKVLEDNNIYDRTILIITSDNGSIGGNTPLFPEDSIPSGTDTVFHHHGNKDWRGRKTHIWEGGNRVPLIIRWPGHTKPGTLSDHLVCLTDLMPTLCHVVGATLPKETAPDGFDILSLIQGEETDSVRTTLVTHSAYGKFAVINNNWKLIFTQGSGGWGSSPADDYPPGQLYNLETDPAETNNLYHTRNDMVGELENLLQKYKRTGRSNDQ